MSEEITGIEGGPIEMYLKGKELKSLDSNTVSHTAFVQLVAAECQYKQLQEIIVEFKRFTDLAD